MLEVITIWTLVAVILHFCDVGAFKDWPIISWPWKWSCCCLFLWAILIIPVTIILCTVFAIAVPVILA